MVSTTAAEIRLASRMNENQTAQYIPEVYRQEPRTSPKKLTADG